MIYDKLPVTLLTALTTQDPGSAYGQLSNYVLSHAGGLDGISIKELATACHVGVGTVSRFARDMGFQDFAELRAEFARVPRSFERVAGDDTNGRADALALGIASSIEQVRSTIDHRALSRLVKDLGAYNHISAFGLLKAQAAAVELQVGLLGLGRIVDTCTSAAEQFSHIADAKSDELVIVFSYTGDYFAAYDFGASLRRSDRPRIWVVCGATRPLPPFVYDRLVFESRLDQIGHPYQLQYVAGLIAQEYAAIDTGLGS